jgi:hypothetical protein
MPSPNLVAASPTATSAASWMGDRVAIWKALVPFRDGWELAHAPLPSRRRRQNAGSAPGVSQPISEP